MSLTVRNLLCQILAGMATCVVAIPVTAQWVGSPWDPRRPSLLQEVTEEAADSLALSESQRVSLESLLRTFVADRAALAMQFEDGLRKQRELEEETGFLQGPNEEMARLLRRDHDIVVQDFKRQRAFELAVEAILDEGQRTEWRRLKAERRRQVLMVRQDPRLRLSSRGTRFAAEPVDVFGLASSILDHSTRERPEMTELLRAHEQRLDALLQKMERLSFERVEAYCEERIATSEGTYIDPLAIAQEDVNGLSINEVLEFGDAMQRLGMEMEIDQQRALFEVAEEIAALNRLTMSQLRAFSGEHEARRLQEAFAIECYPNLYAGVTARARFNAHAYFSELLESDLLSEEQRGAVGAHVETFFQQFTMIADRLAQLRDREEAEWEDTLRGCLDPSIPEDRQRLLAQRRELQETAIARVQSTLTAEQQDAIKPSLDSTGW